MKRLQYLLLILAVLLSVGCNKDLKEQLDQYGSDNLLQGIDSQFVHERGKFRNNLRAGEGVAEVRRTDLHRRGARHHHFDDVPGGGHAAAAHHGNPAGVSDLIHHTEGDWEYGRPGETAHPVGDDGFPAGDVDAHPQEGVHEREAVGPRVLAGAGLIILVLRCS